MKKTILLASFVVCLFTANSVFAGRMWYYSDVLSPSGQYITSAGSAIGMRSDGTWPVVAYSNSSTANGVAVMLPGSWTGRTSTFVGQPQLLDGATAPDGTVGFVDSYGDVVTLNKNGWGGGYVSSSTSSQYKNSIAFNNDSAPAVLYKSFNNNYLALSMKSGSDWVSSTVQTSSGSARTSNYYALDFDSYNQANIAYQYNGKLAYGVKGIMTSSQWQLAESETAPTVYGAMDMALSNNDIPFVVYLSNSSTLSYATYDRITASWISGILDSAMIGSPAGNFTVAADENGGIGVAYVAYNTLKYAYNDGSGWSLPETLVAAQSNYSVGLTFDYENNPVISYMDQATGRLKLAYDPYVVPEPATMAIFALGLALIRRK